MAGNRRVPVGSVAALLRHGPYSDTFRFMPLVLLISAVVSLLLAIYAQWQIPRFTRTRAGVLITRSLLLAVGCAFGYVVSSTIVDDRVPPLLAFLIGFGAVHLPAAFILFFKGAGGAGKS